MKRPEKKLKFSNRKVDVTEIYVNRGYNQALDDMDEYLPGEEEIQDIIGNTDYPRDEPIAPNSVYIFSIAKALHKRIRE